MYGREAPKNDEIDQLRNGDLALEPGDLLAAVAGPLGGARGRGSPPGADLSSGNLGRKVESQVGAAVGQTNINGIRATLFYCNNPTLCLANSTL